ncbi:hypothetical protein [Rhizobium sp. 18065]|uniref:hypothetical protein n=1 Tax=Rhizobium sp. 18065 TaxID=2681411 RepID=UPI001358F59B|nr:hypothetical protein [Rhizobium sp. 18065]
MQTDNSMLDGQMIEGRLNAHREILISLLTSALLRPDSTLELLRSLEEEVMMHDGAEDPGLTPSAGIARGGEKSEEIRQILETAKARADALSRQAQAQRG